MDHSEVQKGCQQWRVKKLSRSERFKMMDDMSLMSKKKLEIKAMARARMPKVSQQIDDTLNRVAALKEKMKGEEDAKTSED